MKRSGRVAACALGLLAGCAGMGDEPRFRPELGWSLCRAPLPIELASYAGGEQWTEDQRAHVAGSVALAFALRCEDSAAVAEQARGYRGITAVNSPNANQVSVYPAAGSALASRAPSNLVVEIPAHADYRTDEFLADLRNGISCGLVPGEVANLDNCLPD